MTRYWGFASLGIFIAYSLLLVTGAVTACGLEQTAALIVMTFSWGLGGLQAEVNWGWPYPAVGAFIGLSPVIAALGWIKLVA